MGLIGEPKLVDTAAAGRELHQLGKASHRGHGGHREGIEVGEISTLGLGTAWLAGGERRERGEASHGQVLAIDQPLNTVLKACFTEID